MRFIPSRSLFKLGLLAMIPLLCRTQIMAQEENDEVNQLISNTIEEFLESTDSENFDYNTIFENLNQYYLRPLNINTVGEAQLKDLFILNELQISNFLLYRGEFGDFIAIQELQAIPGWDLNVINTVLPFLRCSKQETGINLDWRDAIREGNSTLFVKSKRVLQRRKGFLPNSAGETPFDGDPSHLYVRYRFEYGQNLKAGFTAEKDPGERFFGQGSPNGFDFYSFFLFAQNLTPKVKAVALGDFAVSLGQGLILHNDFGAGKSSYVMNVKKSGRTIRPYSSVNEVNFFRGGGLVYQVNPRIQTTLFASYKPIDASVDRDTTENSDFDAFGSIRFDGFHRTQTEILNKNSIHQSNVGGKVQYKLRDLAVSFNGLYTQFDKPLVRDDALYRKYLFAGDNLTNVSVDYQWRKQNATFFGEAAYSGNGGLAQIHGVLLGLDRKVDMSVVYRNYAADYQVLNANAFAEGSQPINERGVYMGLDIRPYKRIMISTYVDFWNNPWVSYRRDGQTEGREFLVKALYSIKRKLDFYVQYRFEQKQINSSALGKIDYPVETEQHRLRFHLAYKISKEWEIRDRVEWSLFNHPERDQAKGFMMYQDILYKPIAKKLSFNARYAIFDINSFDARIYAYENDLLYEFYIPFFQNRGTRFYINTRYRLTRSMTIEGRIGTVSYDNIDVISSGNNEINGNTMTEAKMQIKLKF